MKKVLLINRGGSDNLGDQAIKVSLEKLLENMNCEVDFSDFTNIYKETHYQVKKSRNDSKVKIKKKLLAIIPSKCRWIVKNYKIYKPCFGMKKYDIAIIGGGQLINNNKVFALAMYLWVYLLKFNKNIKVIIFGVGAMRDLTKSDRFFYKNALNKADEVFVRDIHSKKVIKELFGIDSKVTYDVAFSFNLDDSFESNALKDVNSNERKKVLVGVSHFLRYLKYNNDKDAEEYYNYWAEYIINMFKSNLEVKLFYTTSEDLEVALAIQNLVKEKYSVRITVVDVKNLDELIHELKQADEVISPRMHALILAKLCDCDIKPVYISQKIKSFSEHYLGEDFSLEKIQERIVEDLNSVIN